MAELATVLIVVLVLLIVYFSFAADIVDIFACVGNPLLRKLGLQGDGKAGKELLGRRAKVSSVEGEVIRVMMNGTTWSARPTQQGWLPKVGEEVVVKSVDGLTLDISPEDTNVANSPYQR